MPKVEVVLAELTKQNLRLPESYNNLVVVLAAKYKYSYRMR